MTRSATNIKIKRYLFKFNEEFNGNIFIKACVPPTRIVDCFPKGQVRLLSDCVGCYVEADFHLPDKLGFAFLRISSEIIDRIRYINFINIMEVFNYLDRNYNLELTAAKTKTLEISYEN